MFRTAILVVAALGTALAACPDGWVTYGVNCYWRSSYTASWRDAQTHCVALYTGSNLVTIINLDENNFLCNNLGAKDTWIGLNDLTNEGHFVWADGSPVTYTNWMDGQPNNLLDQDCVNIGDAGSGRWDDNHCVETKTFICKL